MEIVILIGLILLNGLFSMSEIALVSARKARLEGQANKGDKKAKEALELANHPDRFLSTVQIGITLIGILTGIFSGENIKDDFVALLNELLPDNIDGEFFEGEVIFGQFRPPYASVGVAERGNIHGNHVQTVI